jgi:MSHA biogenesis protein MshQ
LPSIQPGSNNVNLSFVSGVASFWLRTTDVGKYAINLADTSNSFSNSTISGSSSTMVARPFGIRINVSANTGASNSSGPTFRKSGQPFTVTVTAVGWQSADDGNNDGIPDGHNDYDPTNNADLSNNLSLVSFATPIVLGSKLIQPAGGVESGLSGGAYSSFTVGSASAPDVAYGDVGIIELTAAISGIGNNYLGSPGSQKILGRSGYVGRFYPDHFRLSDLGVQSGCNSVLPYSYLEEPFSLTAKVTPYNAAGIAVQNYKDGFNKFNTNVFANMLSAIDEDTPVSLTSRITVTSDATAYSWNAGVLTAAPKIKINRSAAPDGPFPQVRVGFTPMDADGVTLRASDLNLDTDGDGTADAARIGTTTMGLRYGRLTLDDSYGPETTNLPVIFRTEYWDGSEWKQNRDDSCTQIALTEIAYPDGAIHVAAHRSPAVGGGSTTGEYADLGASSVGFTEGDAGHYFTAPGTGNTGAVQVQVNLTNYPWLRFDWNNDGDFTDSSLPAANFTFGNYRGHDRVLYWIEAGGY